MALKRDDIIELFIDDLAFGGEGVGHLLVEDKRFAIFVEDTVPGDRVKVKIGGKKKNYAYGYVQAFLEKSPLRITPRCPHFNEGCGGCSLQSLPYKNQLKIKEQQVKEALKRIGGMDPKHVETLVRPIIGCEKEWFYRNKMEFSFTKEADGNVGLGLHLKRRHHDLVELQECFLLEPYIGSLVEATRNFFRTLLKAGHLSEGRLESFVVREGKHTGEIMVHLIVENSTADFFDSFTTMILDYFEKKTGAEMKGKKLVSIYGTIVHNMKGQPKRRIEKLLWGEKTIHEYMELPGGQKLMFEILPQAFFQPNTYQAEILYTKVLEASGLLKSSQHSPFILSESATVPQKSPEILFDLFCGTGTIGLFCAPFVKKVYGIELNESAVENARANAILNNISTIEFLAGDVEKVISRLPNTADVVILDPPRGGLLPGMVEKVLRIKSPTLVYVSCNPTALARDAKLLAENYILQNVQPVDMFPQTYHIECVARFKLRDDL